MEPASTRRYLLTTFGCQMNLADGQRIRGILEGLGFVATEREEEADLILFNTCSVREHAEERLVSRVQTLKQLKRQKPHLIIGIAGCMAQNRREALFGELPIVDLVFGPNDIEDLPALLADLGPGGARTGAFASTGRFDGDQADGIVLERPYAAFVNIIRGCTNCCSYCIVPFVRGPEVSRPLDEIVGFCRDLAGRGVSEITVLGQNVNVYGKDLGLEDGFPRLLEAIEAVAGIRRIRFLTSHPRDFDRAALERLAGLKKLVRCFHLPVQAGCSRILELMNRGYTREQYLELVGHVRALFPDHSLTTDLICGFPSETEEEFEETLDLVREVRFDSAFMYYYSPRPGTRACDMPGQRAESVRKARLSRLIDLQQRLSLEASQRLVGREYEVLVEGVSAHDSGNLIGKTMTDRTVDFPGGSELIGQYVRVVIDRARSWTLSGRRC